ncbi:hypothetical protein CHS0354_040964 [Potamilus streckersoni]|uniref:Uncharacterized protein n=1 Tax=Potamilus streckersoni TaxID=2493646 RepID=A0AAE0W9G4_9BIVA|nr:hypothetical protein CHS0354_040964 [Potamilus streckersoni]
MREKEGKRTVMFRNFDDAIIDDVAVPMWCRAKGKFDSLVYLGALGKFDSLVYLRALGKFDILTNFKVCIINNITKTQYEQEAETEWGIIEEARKIIANTRPACAAAIRRGFAPTAIKATNNHPDGGCTTLMMILFGLFSDVIDVNETKVGHLCDKLAACKKTHQTFTTVRC